MSEGADRPGADEERIFHLALPEDWAATFEDGWYRTSTRGMTLDDVGFIHCSSRFQIEATANRFYADVDQLVLLTIDPGRVGAPVEWEPPAPGVDELFPHIYGPLPVAAVSATKFWQRGVDGVWSLD